MKDMGARKLGEILLKKDNRDANLPKRDSQSDNFYKDFIRNVIVFKESLPRLLNEIPGEYVAILSGEIIDHRSTWESVFTATREAHPNAFVLIERVEQRPTEFIDMDSLST